MTSCFVVLVHSSSELADIILLQFSLFLTSYIFKLSGL